MSSVTFVTLVLPMAVSSPHCFLSFIETAAGRPVKQVFFVVVAICWYNGLPVKDYNSLNCIVKVSKVIQVREILLPGRSVCDSESRGNY